MNAREVILAVMRDVQGVAKRDKNTAQGFNFRGIDAVLNAVGPVLRAHGGFIVPEVLSTEVSTGQTAKGGVINIVRLQVRYSVFGADGDPIVGDVQAEAFDSGDKATAKAMSVALRTFLIQLLALPTDEPDPDTFSYELGSVDVKTGEVKTRDWLAEIDKVKTTAYARELYLEAQKAKVDKSVLEAITAKAKTLG